MPNTDVMLDIETLGTGAGAAIVSIGALRFNRAEPDLSNAESFYSVVKVRDDIGQLSPETVAWWMRQSQEARDAIFAESAQATAKPLTEVLSELAVFLEGAERLWSNGPLFDERIVREACERLGVAFPLEFRASRCCRTMYDLHFEALGQGAKCALDRALAIRVPSAGRLPKHHALGDCYRQAAHVQAIFPILMPHVVQ